MDLLKKGIRADGTVAYSATVEIRTTGPGGHGPVFVQKIVDAGGNRRRVGMVGPRGRVGHQIIADGRYEWDYRPGAHVVHRRELRSVQEVQRARLSALDLVAGTLHAGYAGKATVAGRKCYVITVKPPDGRVTRKRVWMDIEHLIELKWERYGPNGKLTTQWTARQVDFTPSLDAARFRFSPPPGCKVISLPLGTVLPLSQAEKKVGFRAILPSYTPPGFALERDRVVVTSRGGTCILWMRFLNGVDSFSLFESRQAQTKPRVPGHMLYWESDGLSFLLMGDISMAEKRKVKESTQR